MSKDELLLLMAEWYCIPIVPYRSEFRERMQFIQQYVGTLRWQQLTRYINIWFNEDDNCSASSEDFANFIILVREATQDD